ncbi:unnamed protein product [Darwinula stevensoni]|uniref:BRO1 domain-containing protein n=1 Tax=Darwinula stevensoni TaxID=69355 RepID=A0A7R8XFI6_9CRUS|nr:unnamed protein product [Darwinula stevensoni]CAG0895584.1 unnamed protein product [Darwinula stevensoni]
MEGVPRLPMLSFEVKRSPKKFDFAGKLQQLIAQKYHEDPDKYMNEIHELEALRASAVYASMDFNGCSTLKRYYCQLHFIKNRFPWSPSDHKLLHFTWQDIATGIQVSVPDIDFEIACVLYNIGSLHTQLGAADSRTSSEGMKISCTHFQCAAWAFEKLLEMQKEKHEGYFRGDLGREMLTFLSIVSLAQAQECILEKSMVDQRKHTITAKVAAQIVDFYGEALKFLSGTKEDTPVADTVNSSLAKQWKKYVEFKMGFYQCITYLYQGLQTEDQQQLGARVAYYKAALDKLGETEKLIKGIPKQEVK